MNQQLKTKIQKHIDKLFDAERIANYECNEITRLLNENGYSKYIAQRVNSEGLIFANSENPLDEYYSLDELIKDSKKK